ncbi:MULTISPECIES: hypothetical protein [Methylomonas]|nr:MULTISPECIES: hypothetical protein [Methylomonas]
MRTNAWSVRGFFGSGQFWDDSSLGFERGLDTAFPILMTGGNLLSLLEPINGDAIPVAIHTDNGFFGIIPDNETDGFFLLKGAREIYNIQSVTPIIPVSIPDLVSMWLLGIGIGFLAMIIKEQSRYKTLIEIN